ncbi:MAG: hypothetical protein L0Z62_40635 [Gemmataceae bacterium]|nr:hypothetical protein [Gemmataceae bacterium]
MGATDLLAALKRKPFEPFRIITSDGVRYDIRHPDLVALTHTGAIIGSPDPDQPGLWLRYDVVGLEHVVRLEQLLQPHGTEKAS